MWKLHRELCKPVQELAVLTLMSPNRFELIITDGEEDDDTLLLQTLYGSRMAPRQRMVQELAFTESYFVITMRKHPAAVIPN